MGKVPKLRFEGFEGDWEEKKLEDVVVFLDTLRKPLEGTKRMPGPYPYYGASGIVDYVDDYIFDEELILLSEDGANITDRNYPVCFLASGKYWVNNHAHVLKRKEGNDNNFICTVLEQKDYKRYNTGMAMPKLNQEVCRKIPIICPGSKEQKRLGDFFRVIDSLGTFHKCKHAALLKAKQFYLQNLFPRKGEKTPRLRFAGFSGEWEEKKLGELAEKATQRNSEIKYTETFTNSAEFGIISQNDYFDHSITNSDNISGYYIVHEDDFVYNPRISNLAPYGPINRNKLGRIGIMSPLYTVFRANNTNLLYLEWYFKSESWYRFMYMNGDSGARSDRFAIKDAVFFEMPIALPCDEEQHAIGNFLSNLDHLITTQQRKLETLKRLKQFLLQNLFV